MSQMCLGAALCRYRLMVTNIVSDGYQHGQLRKLVDGKPIFPTGNANAKLPSFGIGSKIINEHN